MLSRREWIGFGSTELVEETAGIADFADQMSWFVDLDRNTTDRESTVKFGSNSSLFLSWSSDSRITNEAQIKNVLSNQSQYIFVQFFYV